MALLPGEVENKIYDNAWIGIRKLSGSEFTLLCTRLTRQVNFAPLIDVFTLKTGSVRANNPGGSFGA